MLLRQTLLFLSKRAELEDFLKKHPTARRAAGRFFAGETRGEALAVARSLAERGLSVTFDYLGEEVSDAEEARAAAEEYAAVAEEAAAENLRAGVSVKLTNLGIRIGEDLAYENLMTVVRRAAGVGRFVRVDMEGSDLTKITMKMVMKAHKESPNVGAVLQSALRRSDKDLRLLNRRGISVRLVKGAYLEEEEVAYQDKEEVDLYFMRLIEGLIHSGTSPAIATHDEKLIEFTIDLADIFDRKKEEFEFQMLYGIRQKLQEKLAGEGYRVRIYLPYGKDWYGYFMRRLAERPANLWFLMRHLRK